MQKKSARIALLFFMIMLITNITFLVKMDSKLDSVDYKKPLEIAMKSSVRVLAGLGTRLGSGTIISRDGYIITNWHIVQSDAVVLIIDSNKVAYKGLVIERFPSIDLCIVKIKAKKPFIKANLQRKTSLGERMVAIGNPHGLFLTAAHGIVTGYRFLAKIGPATHTTLIQTDLGLNPGNSGGGLFNMQGELVGVAVAIQPNSNSISFIIPTDSFLKLVERYTLN